MLETDEEMHKEFVEGALRGKWDLRGSETDGKRG